VGFVFAVGLLQGTLNTVFNLEKKKKNLSHEQAQTIAVK